MSFELFMLGKARKETIVSIGGKIMANLSQQRREQMLSFLETLKEQHNDDASLIAINQIEKELTSKKYGLVWEEHEEEVDVKMKTHIPVFTEVKEKEIVGNSESDEFNFLLEGDNLHSLRLLEKTHKGKIDVIYIDPPYNTGHKDFIYDDAFVDRQDGYSHSKWISFMEKRLKIAHSLLKSSGTIFISIDDNEYANLKLLCDEIFGEENMISDIIWNSRKSVSNDAVVSLNHNYTLVYTRNINEFNKVKHLFKLKNVLIIVDNIDESIDFYEELFGLRVITSQEGNVIMSEGLVLQDVDVWYDSTKIPTTPHNNMTELDFEDNDIEGIIEKLESGKYVVSYVTDLMELECGQKLVRFYDPSGNLIEVRTPINYN